ncbi:MAG: 2-iminoacetate synthase ThiH/Menaquinone biosynthesis enzymes MqnC and MqnE [Candidatus Alkanophagales archaeon MCA70_species_2]|nr:2-iminoacetate synthase ThiH/Menaquinone biosynthesis enzymes MqnC and MqnE [Candidatus Alkanophaga liquidiphilum]
MVSVRAVAAAACVAAAETLYERVRKGDVTKNDAMFLVKNPHLLFRIADELRRAACGDVVTYIVNRNINFTNVCIGSCKFCAFRRKTGEGYLLGIEEIINKIAEAVERGAVEVCIQGGLHPDFCIEDYCEILERIKENFDVHIHAFSPMEVKHAADNSKLGIEDVLEELKAAGLDSMPGTAAEILVDKVRHEICPKKLRTEEWVKIIKAAHRIGIPTTATMMFGHVETAAHRIEHLFLIRKIQQETKGFTEFIPLPFMPKNNELGRMIGGRAPSFFECAVVHALARVVLHGLCDNIQASWVKLTPKGAKKMLDFGANDLGGTLMEENISKAAGATSGEYMSPEALERLIREAGRIPRKRNTLYELL